MTRQKAIADLEAGIPVDPAVLIQAGISITGLIVDLVGQRKMLKARVTALESAMVLLAKRVEELEKE